MAPAVKNSRTIQAKLGKVVLGGAQTYTVDFYGDGLISLDVGPKVTAVPTKPDGQPVKSLVSNTGRIEAPGGTVVLTAESWRLDQRGGRSNCGAARCQGS